MNKSRFADETEAPPDLYETAEEDLWFLPGPDLDEEEGPPGASPLPRADRRSLVDATDWGKAQAALSAELARVSQVFGELDTRLRSATEGVHRRLALREASDLSWWIGGRVTVDRLGLWLGLRIGSVEDIDQALSHTAWAARRLGGGPLPKQALAVFLDRGAKGRGLAGNAIAGSDAVLDLTDVLATVETLHPLVQAAVLFHTWRILGQDRTRDLEAAVLAARHAASLSRIPGQGALFLPLATSGARALQGTGDPERKLAAWLAGAEQATLAALLQLDQIERWSRRARDAILDLSGRTPGQLVTVFEGWAYVSAPLAEAKTGASRASVQRSIDILVKRDLVREVTGQGRYRIWVAAA
jgi:hypothetical protein